MDLFVYGTLMAPRVMRAVCGFRGSGEVALLHGYARRRVAGASYPAIFPRSDESVAGLVYRGIDDTQCHRLDLFEGAMYRRDTVEVSAGDAVWSVQAYVLATDHATAVTTEAWSIDDFLHRHLDSFLAGYSGFAGLGQEMGRND